MDEFYNKLAKELAETDNLATWKEKGELFKLHSEVFPEIRDAREIAKRLASYGHVSSLLALSTNKVSFIKDFLLKVFDLKTNPNTGGVS